MVAATYKYLSIPGAPKPTFAKFMREMKRMYKRGPSTRVGKPRGIWIGMKGLDSRGLLKLAEMFIREDANVLIGNMPEPGGPPAEDMVPCSREAVLKTEYEKRMAEMKEKDPQGLDKLLDEMGRFGMYSCLL